MKKLYGLPAALIAVILMLAAVVPAYASWDTDISAGNAVTIGEADPFKVDTFLGVSSYHSEKSAKYTPSELVVRFYKNAYGLEISASGAPTVTTTGYEFKVPSTPQQGDIVYGGGSHWGIVKSFSRGKIVLFEQGNAKDGKAVKDRQLVYPSNSYTVYTPRSKTGYAYPVLKDVATGKVIPLSRVPVSEPPKLPPATSVPSTTGSGSIDIPGETDYPTTPSTTEATTTKPNIEFTTYQGNDEPYSYEEGTFTTVSMPEGYEEFFTSEPESTEEPFDPNAYYSEYYENDGYNGKAEDTTASAPKQDKALNPTLVFGIAMIGGIVCITGAGVAAGLIIKKRSEDDD